MYPEPRNGIVFIQAIVYVLDYCVSKKIINYWIKCDMQQCKTALLIINWKLSASSFLTPLSSDIFKIK